MSSLWTEPARRSPSFSADGTPIFLNKRGTIGTSGDWQHQDASRLWLYNLHYFDDLNAAGAEERLDHHNELIQRWVAENRPFRGVGWEPYPCSLRIINWLKWVLADHALSPAAVQSLALQAAWLEKNIERHLLGNHLFANAKALIFAGSLFDGDDAGRWLQRGLDILDRELAEQVLEDGGQFELSPMYHAIAVEDLLDLINLANAFPGKVPERSLESWRVSAKKMLRWASVMRHPDQQIPLFNDSAFGIAPDPDQLFSYTRRLGVEFDMASDALHHLEQSGYIRAAFDDVVLFADVGRIGPDYLPGHAHADTLGFELSLFGHRWFVDSGCSTYEESDERLRQRGTAAHNTVVVDGQDSSEVWKSFRVARRAKPHNVSSGMDGDTVVITGAHDGYCRLPGRVTHNRSFHLQPSKLEIADWLDGDFVTAEANLLLHPDVSVATTETGIELYRNGCRCTITVDGGDPTIRRSSWHPEFGKSIDTHRISIAFTKDALNTTISWAP